MTARYRIVAFLGLGIALTPASTLAVPCSEHERSISTAMRNRDADSAAQITKAAGITRDCQGVAMALLGRNAALVFYARAYEQSTPHADRRDLLDRGLKLGRPWQILAAAADIELGAKKFDSAATLYQEALDDIRDAKFNPQAPPRDVIKGLFKKAEASRLLATTYSPRTDRSGAPGGLACTSFRGFTVERTALPIEFDYNKVTFAPKGQAAADDLLTYLKEQGAPAIRLVGHTDPVGGDTFNRTLSEGRAAAVKAFLVAKGYKAAIQTSGRGKDQPFEPDDPGGYTEAERHQMDRRVELDRMGAKACGASAE